MKELIEFMARSIVDNPDAVVVSEEDTEDHIVYHLKVADDDMGRVIGKQGRVANAMRTLLKVAAIRQGARAVLEIGDDIRREAPRRDDRDERDWGRTEDRDYGDDSGEGGDQGDEEESPGDSDGGGWGGGQDEDTERADDAGEGGYDGDSPAEDSFGADDSRDDDDRS